MKDREGEKEWREGMEGGRERLSHYNTDFPHTHQRDTCGLHVLFNMNIVSERHISREV